MLEIGRAGNRPFLRLADSLIRSDSLFFVPRVGKFKLGRAGFEKLDLSVGYQAKCERPNGERSTWLLSGAVLAAL